MPYSAVIHPCLLSLRNGGTRSSTDAVHNTWVFPKETKTEPSACCVNCRLNSIGLNAFWGRWLGLIGVVPLGWLAPTLACS